MTCDLTSLIDATDAVPKIFVVGKGSAGLRHAKLVAEEMPDALLVHMGTRDFLQSNSFLEDSPQSSVAENFRFAIVASPASTHLDVAQRFLNRGIPVLVEKPLASNLADARAIVKAGAQSETLVKVGYVMRYYEGFARVEQLLSENVVGKPYFTRFDVGQYLPDWRPTQDYRATVSAQASLGGGVLLELSHEIDLALNLFGCPSEVSCEADRYGSLEIDVEDSATISLYYGAASERYLKTEIRMDFLRRAPTRTLEVHGSEGVLVWDMLANNVRYWTVSTGTWTSTPEIFGSVPDPFLRQLRTFASEVVGGFDWGATGLEVIDVIEMCRESIALAGQAVAFRGSSSE